jgi:hypothetical protein
MIDGTPNTVTISINGKVFFVHPTVLHARWAVNIQIGAVEMPPVVVDAGSVIDISSDKGGAVPFTATVEWHEAGASRPCVDELYQQDAEPTEGAE